MSSRPPRLPGHMPASSRATVPWPSRVSRWSKACTLIAPEICHPRLGGGQRVGVAFAGDDQVRAELRMRSTLAGADTVGTKILAGTPRRCAA